MSYAIYVGSDLTADGPRGRQHPPGAVIEVGLTASAATPGV